MMTGRRSMHDWQSWMRKMGYWEVVMCPQSSLLLPRVSLCPPLLPNPPNPPSLRLAPRTRPEVTWPNLWLTSSLTRIPPLQRWAQQSWTGPTTQHQHRPVRVCLQVWAVCLARCLATSNSSTFCTEGQCRCSRSEHLTLSHLHSCTCKLAH